VTRRFLLGLLGPLLLLVVLGGVVWVSTDVPLPGEVQTPQRTVVLWADGSEMARVGVVNRTSVPLEAVSTAARQAVLSAEDRDFYDQPGVSLRGTARALWVNLRGREVAQGGSTITQQYVRNAVLTPERTLSRKLREVAIAVKLDATTPKDEVLERYLDIVYFGRGAYGIEAAAQTFFAVPAAELTAEQGAVLAALLRSPTAYDPEAFPDRAQQRWRYVVDGMVDRGWLDGPAERYAYPPVLPRGQRGDSFGGPSGYLVAQALDEVRAVGVTQDRLDLGGLVVATTVERRVQDAAVAAVRSTTGETIPDGVYRALAAVEPGTGRIRAVYAGDDYVSRPFNAATQGTAQAGSSFKAYVLAAALRSGISLDARFDGASPQTFGDYRVSNAGGGSFGTLDLVEATARSVNTVFVPLGKRAGLADVAATAAELGITADMSVEDSLASLSLGVTAVSPLDQANAFATLAAGGVRAQPYLVEQVADRDGFVLHQAQPQTRRVLEENVAADVTFALQRVVTGGTGRAARLPDRPAAGKTGTTNENTAAWFVGYTPQLATAVAIYSERKDVPLRGLFGVREISGGSLPARAWSRFTAAALEGAPVLPFPERARVGAAPSGTPTPTTYPTLPPRPEDDGAPRQLAPPGDRAGPTPAPSG
jgi:membrane peptidoglycan carboxypeptidase